MVPNDPKRLSRQKIEVESVDVRSARREAKVKDIQEERKSRKYQRRETDKGEGREEDKTEETDQLRKRRKSKVELTKVEG